MGFLEIAALRRSQQPGMSAVRGQREDAVCRGGRKMQLSSERRKSASFSRMNILQSVGRLIHQFRAWLTSSDLNTLAPKETAQSDLTPGLPEDSSTFSKCACRQAIPSSQFSACEKALALDLKAIRKQHSETMPVKGRQARNCHDRFDQYLMTELQASLKISCEDASQDRIETRFWKAAVNACYAVQTANIPALPRDYLQWMRRLLGACIKQSGQRFRIPEQDRKRQSEWIDALCLPVASKQPLGARQCIVHRHHIIENLLQNAAGMFSKAEKIPLVNLSQRRVRDANKLRELAIHYLEELDWQPYYKDISPKIKSWIAFCCAQEEFDIQAQNAVQVNMPTESVTPLSDADIEGLANYRTSMQPLLRRANTEFATALGMAESELNSWWALEQIWIGWEETRSSAPDAPIQDFTKICAAIACASHVRSSRAREDPDLRIRPSAMAFAQQEFANCQRDYFMKSDFNPLPIFVATILNKLRLQFPPQRF